MAANRKGNFTVSTRFIDSVRKDAKRVSVQEHNHDFSESGKAWEYIEVIKAKASSTYGILLVQITVLEDGEPVWQLRTR